MHLVARGVGHLAALYGALFLAMVAALDSSHSPMRVAVVVAIGIPLVLAGAAAVGLAKITGLRTGARSAVRTTSFHGTHHNL